MRILKIILIVILIIIAIPLLTALFIKKDYAVEREITINKPKQEVFDYIKYLKNQDHYSKWAMMDPDMKKTYRGTDATVGFVSAWESDKKDVGTGEQEIKKITEGERLDFELRFIKPFESTVDIPKDVSYSIVKKYLDKGEKENQWSYKEACLAHDIN